MASSICIQPRNARCAFYLNKSLNSWSVRGISKLTVKPDPKKTNCDYIGPVDETSNLRQHVYHIPENETALQRQLRELRNQVYVFNQQFWQKHNESFYKERQDFINEQKSAGYEEVTADKMSEFYKKFLDENHERHVTYNKVWYQYNFKILLLAFRVELERILKKFV